MTLLKNMRRTRLAPSSLAASKGLSLVELLVAILLGIFLTWGVIQAFLTGKQTFSLQNSLSRIQETGRLAQEFIDNDIRMAGDYGCGSSDAFFSFKAVQAGQDENAGSDLLPNSREKYNPNRINLIKYTENGLQDFEKAARGYNNVQTAPFTVLNPAPIPGTDVLLLHPTREVGTLQNVLLLNSIPSKITFLPNGLAGSNTQSFIAVSDCTKTRMFHVSSDGTVQNSNPGMDADISQTFAAVEGIAQGASVKRINTVIYYIGRDATNNNIPTLYRYDQALGLNEAMFAGVEDLQIEFGVDSDRDNNIDAYYAPNVVPEKAWSVWNGAEGTAASAVRAVRYSLLIRAEDSVINETQKINYPPFVADAEREFHDRKMRLIFTGAVGIRSRVVMD